MADAPVLLDTDILSAIMRKNPAALQKAREYLLGRQRFTISIITRYEILRGLKAKSAIRQIEAFEALCEQSTVLSLTDAAIHRAADIYAELHRRGQLIGDADILIAASALEQNLGVATNNAAHFRRIDGLRIESWLV